jgi:sarcosine oxidase delta subunit
MTYEEIYNEFRLGDRKGPRYRQAVYEIETMSDDDWFEYVIYRNNRDKQNLRELTW